jgi:dienelactone hydrolase
MRVIEYRVGSIAMRSELYEPLSPAGSGRKAAGVLVFPEAFGVSDYTRGRAKSLSELGYAALACDLHGDGKLLTDTPTVMRELAGALSDVEEIRARASGAYEALLAASIADPSRIAAMGYCFGGTMALELARAGTRLAALAGFHCGLQSVRPADAKNIAAPVLLCLGADDPIVTAAQRAGFEEQMRGTSVDWQMHVYGGTVHSFTNPAADALNNPSFVRYSPSADKRSWGALLAFLNEALA